MKVGFSNRLFQLQCTSLRQFGTPDIGIFTAPRHITNNPS